MCPFQIYIFACTLFFKRWVLVISDPGQQYRSAKMANVSGEMIKQLQLLEAHYARIKCVDLHWDTTGEK